MSLEKAVRNTLRIVVTQSRRLLEEAIGELLQGQFGIHASGKIEDAATMGHLSAEDHQYREQILIHLEHIRAAGFKPSDAVAQLVREVAFTHLNRLCAYKMMETRGLIREAVSRGLKSRGFLFYLADHPGDEQLWSGGRQDIAYRHFLEWLGGTLSAEIGVLFSPHDSASRLFPPHRVLEQVLELLNSEELKEVWAEDETIGWVYQYFTPKELRDQARKESQAPRNSYELAFRNQFYTPRYVVQFLTDNTLGRTWYEMRQGKTRLKDQCTYLVRRPDEVFLEEVHSPEVAQPQRWLQGEDVPEPDLWSLAHTVNGYNRAGEFGEESSQWMKERLPHLTYDGAKELKTQELLDLLFLFCRYERFSEGTVDSLSREIEVIMYILRERVRPPDKEQHTQEELLRAPVFIPYRAKKDPREIKILDPACGSGHFLLYCFDLLATIYEEAYEDPALAPALKKDYPTWEDLKRAVPALILAHNLHGIDIDLRATQIAALALWLRAQRSYQEMGLKDDERPRITRSNIVCAEPMPGEKDLLEEFVRALQPAMLGDMVRTIFEKMQLASEAGSLLKIEEEIKEAVLEAKQRWLLLSRPGQLDLWSGQSRSAQQKLFEETGITNREFWNGAEAQVIEALHQYARDVANGKDLARQLFADDVAQGFAFIDICQKRFDVVLMNPPFGEPSKPSKSYIEYTYRRTKNDIYAAFIERWLSKLVPGGMLGAITSRTGFFLASFQDWREQILLGEARVHLMADLGYGVLDAAMVETGAYCIEKGTRSHKSIFIPILGSEPEQKSSILLKAVTNLKAYTLVDIEDFSLLPTTPFAYWLPKSAFEIFSKFSRLQSHWGELIRGPEVFDLDESVRLWSEIASQQIGMGKRWCYYAKGGQFRRFASDIHLVVAFGSVRDGTKPFRRPGDGNFYFKPGITYTQRTTSVFNARVLPTGCLTSPKGPAIVPNGKLERLYFLLSIVNSKCFSKLIEIRVGAVEGAARSYDLGILRDIPIPGYSKVSSTSLDILAKEAISAINWFDISNEISTYFIGPGILAFKSESQTLGEASNLVRGKIESINAQLLGIQYQIDEIIWDLYGIPDADRQYIEEPLNSKQQALDDNLIATGAEDEDVDSRPRSNVLNLVRDLISYCVGCAYGRWDIRFATYERPMPDLPDPFAPLPACSPGMLTGNDGLPLHEAPPAYPVTINRDGILVDDPDHPDDIVRRIRDVLGVIWKDDAEAIEQEACQLLGVKELRDYFRRPGNDGFWMDHVKRYSKSRRKAPIYWLLQSSKRSYALWLYYHRLDKDILFKALTNYVEPKLRLEEGRVAQLRAQLTGSGSAGREVKQLERQLERQESLMAELYDFRDKLRRAADLQLAPDLNDGVVLNIAPLWELVPWSEARKYWEELRAGKYEWSSISKQLRERGVI